jgi:hypothetical protein
LRAEKLAEQAEKGARCRRRAIRMEAGGSGWNDRGGRRAERSDPVVINVRPSARRP